MTWDDVVWIAGVVEAGEHAQFCRCVALDVYKIEGRDGSATATRYHGGRHEP